MKKYRFNKSKFKSFMLSVAGWVLLVVTLVFAIDFMRFPECYSTTMRYQLQTEIQRGNSEMIDYYNRNYVANGRELFD